MKDFVSNIKAVLIDVDDTILDFRLCSQADIKLCLNRHGIPYSDHLYLHARHQLAIRFDNKLRPLYREERTLHRCNRRPVHLHPCVN